MAKASTEDTTSVVDYGDVLRGFITREYSVRNGAKLLARHAKASVRTAESWLHGGRVPSAAALLELMAENTRLCEEIDLAIKARRQRGQK